MLGPVQLRAREPCLWASVWGFTSAFSVRSSRRLVSTEHAVLGGPAWGLIQGGVAWGPWPAAAPST